MNLELAHRAEEIFNSLETYKTSRFQELVKELRGIVQPMIDNEHDKYLKNKYKLKYSYGKYHPYQRIAQINGNLTSAISFYEEASENLERMHAATQDILHALELCELNEKETTELAKQLKEIRKIRREAKDFTELMLPFYDFACRLKDKGILKELGKLNADILRMTESKEKRKYKPRELTDLEPKFIEKEEME